MISFPQLESPRLVLRPLELSDAPDIQKHFASWSIIQHLSVSVPWPYPANGAETFTRAALAEIERGDAMYWTIRLRSAPEEAVGLLGYIVADRPGGNRGFWLAEHLHGQGLMTEAVEAFQDFVFFELGLERIEVGNAINNPASRRVKEKTGARFIGHDKLAHRDGENTSEIWEVTRERWSKLRGRD